MALAIHNAGDLEEQGVVGTVRAGILDRNVAIDAVVFAVEDHVEMLGHLRRAVARDGHRGLEARNVPFARECGRSESADGDEGEDPEAALGS